MDLFSPPPPPPPLRNEFATTILTISALQFVPSVVTVGINDPVPDRGTRVDAISYYTRELAESNKDVFVMQRRKIQVAETGNSSARAYDWLSMMKDFVAGAAITILEDSEEDNGFTSPHDSSHEETFFDGTEVPQAERMASMYGSINSSTALTGGARTAIKDISSKRASLGEIPTFSRGSDDGSWVNNLSVEPDEKSYPLLTEEETVSDVLSYRVKSSSSLFMSI